MSWHWCCLILILSSLLPLHAQNATTTPTNAPTQGGTTNAPSQGATTAPSQGATTAPSQGATTAPTQGATTAPTQSSATNAPTQSGATTAPTASNPTTPSGNANAQPVATPANIVCYQEVVASQGTYSQINASLANWSQRMYQTLGLTGLPELSVGWARVPDRTGFENGCNGPYPAIADLFVHIQTTSSAYDSVSAQLESFIAANRLTSQPNIVCSARSIVTYLPGCGKVGTGGNPPQNATTAPSEAPTQAPSNNATEAPTQAPSNNATEAPTEAPSNNATTAPTEAPSNNATTAPTTEAPTNATEAPTNATEAPTSAPTGASNATEAPTSGPTTAGAPTAAPSTRTVFVNSNFYNPANITINVGDTVEWQWVSGFHTVTSGTPNNPDGKFCSLSGNATASVEACSGTAYAQTVPFTYSHTFTTAGTYPYFCAIHGASMVGSVTVNEQTNTVAGVSSSDSLTGGVTYNGATTTSTSTGIWMAIPIMMTVITMFQH